MAEECREGIRRLSEEKRIRPIEAPDSRPQTSRNVEQHTEDGVTTIFVEGAGHHVQNDVQAEEAAKALKTFLDQL